MSEMGGKPGWRQAPGWMKLVLILSLSVNVAIAGLVGGNALRYWQHGAASGKWRNELAAALAERRRASGQMWGIGYEQMAEIVRRLDAAERVELARRLEERTRRWMGRQERKGR